MSRKHTSLVIVKNAAEASVTELRRMKRAAMAVIRRVEGSVSLPRRAMLDWTLRVERLEGAPCLLVDAVWIHISRPRGQGVTETGKASISAFAVKAGEDRVYRLERTPTTESSLFLGPASGFDTVLRPASPESLAEGLAASLSA